MDKDYRTTEFRSAIQLNEFLAKNPIITQTAKNLLINDKLSYIKTWVLVEMNVCMVIFHAKYKSC